MKTPDHLEVVRELDLLGPGWTEKCSEGGGHTTMSDLEKM